MNMPLIKAVKTTVAVFIRDKKLLMEERDKNKSVYPGFLMCPSGHVEAGESLEQAIRREMKEELGIEVRKARFLFSIEDQDPFSNKKFLHNFMIIEDFNGDIESSKEAKKLTWRSYSELKEQDLVLIVEKLVERLHKIRLL